MERAHRWGRRISPKYIARKKIQLTDCGGKCLIIKEGNGNPIIPKQGGNDSTEKGSTISLEDRSGGLKKKRKEGNKSLFFFWKRGQGKVSSFRQSNKGEGGCIGGGSPLKPRGTVRDSGFQWGEKVGSSSEKATLFLGRWPRLEIKRGD